MVAKALVTPMNAVDMFFIAHGRTCPLLVEVAAAAMAPREGQLSIAQLRTLLASRQNLDLEGTRDALEERATRAGLMAPKNLNRQEWVISWAGYSGEPPLPSDGDNNNGLSFTLMYDSTVYEKKRNGTVHCAWSFNIERNDLYTINDHPIGRPLLDLRGGLWRVLPGVPPEGAIGTFSFVFVSDEDGTGKDRAGY